MSGLQRPTEVTLDADLIEEARTLGIDLSDAAAAGIARAVAGKKAQQRFAEEYADVIRSNNEYVAKHGLPLRKYRSF